MRSLGGNVEMEQHHTHNPMYSQLKIILIKTRFFPQKNASKSNLQICILINVDGNQAWWIIWILFRSRYRVFSLVISIKASSSINVILLFDKSNLISALHPVNVSAVMFRRLFLKAWRKSQNSFRLPCKELTPRD